MFFASVQLLGVIGFVLLVISYWMKDINGVLYLQLISGIFYAIHYYFLGAWVGLFVIIFELFRDFLYYKTNFGKYIFVGTIPFYVVFGIVSFEGIISLYPVVASLVEGFGLAYKKKTAVLGAIISGALWMVYDLMSGSYVGMITCFILLISNAIVFVIEYEKVYIKVK